MKSSLKDILSFQAWKSNFRSQHFCFAAACLAFLGMLLCTIYVSPLPQYYSRHDIFLLLDGGWKWNCGVLPHVDYYSPLGPLTYILTSLGMEIGGSMANAMPGAICLFACCLFPVALYCTFTRMPPLIACLTTVAIIATALAPHLLGGESSWLTYAGIYNRWGYALIMIVFLVISLPLSVSSRWKEILDGAIVGSCLALMVFLKISYGLIGFALISTFAVLRPRRAAYYAAAMSVAIAWTFVFVGLLRWSFAPFVRDMAMAAHARALGLINVFDQVGFLHPQIALVGLLSLLWYLSTLYTSPPRWYFVKIVAWVTVLAMGAAAILASNSPRGIYRESPLFVTGALVMLTLICRDTGVNSGSLSESWKNLHRSVRVIAVIAAMLVTLPEITRNVYSLLIVTHLKFIGCHFAIDERFSSGKLKGIQIMERELAYNDAPPLGQRFQDGLALLTQTGNIEKAVILLDFTNPFNVARGLKPSPGGPTFWHFGFTYTYAIAPPAEQVFRNAEAIMSPKYPDDQHQDHLPALDRHYGNYLRNHFIFAGESEYWQLFVPKPKGAG